MRHYTLLEKMSFGAFTTDESFAILSTLNKAKHNPASFYVTLHLAGYFAWVIGSFLGGVIGSFIPAALGQSFGISLYAMFIALLVPPVKKEWRYGVVAILAMLLNYLFVPLLSEGMRIVLATLLASGVGVIIRKKEVL